MHGVRAEADGGARVQASAASRLQRLGVDAVAASEADGRVREAGRVESGLFLGDAFRRRVFVFISDDERERRRVQPGAVSVEVQVVREEGAPQQEAVGGRATEHRAAGEPARDRRAPLREPERREPNADLPRACEHVRVDGVEQADVVVDLGVARVARHPRCPDAVMRPRPVVEVEPRQPLGCYDEPVGRFDGAERAQKIGGKLTVAVAHHPYFFDGAGWITEESVAGGAVNGEGVLVHDAKRREQPGRRRERRGSPHQQKAPDPREDPALRKRAGEVTP